MLIREMTIDDLASVVPLEHQLFTSAWNYDDFVYEINQNDFSYNYVLEHNCEIVGYIGVWLMYDQSQITTVGVKPEYQRRGYGHDMMKKMMSLASESGCKTMSLEVRVSNEKAISLYKSLGFENVALRKNYYHDNHEDAYLMIKRLEGVQ